MMVTFILGNVSPGDILGAKLQLALCSADRLQLCPLSGERASEPLHTACSSCSLLIFRRLLPSPQCPVFFQPLLATASPTSLSAGNATPGPSTRQQRLRSARNADSPTPSPLPDTEEVPEVLATVSTDPALRMPATQSHTALLPPAGAIAAGPSNTLVATRSGRVFVCGASSSGQCGSVWVKAAVCPGFVDVGPAVGWHGLTRPSAAEVEAAGGQVADALPKVSCTAGHATANAVYA